MKTPEFVSRIASPFMSLYRTLKPLSVFRKRNIPKIAFILVGILTIIIAVLFIKKAMTKPIQNTDARVVISEPKKTKTVNKSFEFPIKDEKGKVVTKLKYTIETADMRDEIVVKGQRVLAVKGKTFLVLTIKIDNSYEKSIDINARDYVRLIVGGNGNELLAADIHNDPVSVQAISTKYTRIGFPVVDTETTFSLQVGEIKGEKETIALEF